MNKRVCQLPAAEDTRSGDADIKRLRTFSWLTGGAVMLFTLLLTSRAQAGSAITVTQTLTQGTCTISSSAAQSGVALPDVMQTEFNSNDIKAAKDKGATFSVDLACTGAPNPSDTNVLTISGTADTADGSGNLFKNLSAGSGAATHLGFVLTQDSDGHGTPLATSALPVSVDVGGAGDNVDSRSVSFFVMPSKGNYAYGDVTAGTLTTTLSFAWDVR
ncbi:fimbrial protein [Enterobacter asburiae]|uniref:fimbrial protein n=1 Tax=Enterobacter asburiae TaxID=61645 RepID=UPI002FFAFB0B